LRKLRAEENWDEEDFTRKRACGGADVRLKRTGQDRVRKKPQGSNPIALRYRRPDWKSGRG